MRLRTLDLSSHEEDIDAQKELVHGYTWHTTSSTERTAQESCTSFCSFGYDVEGTTAEEDVELTTKIRQPTKRVVHFAPELNHTRYVESWKSFSELWWDEEEMLFIRGDCNVVVREYRKHHELVQDLSLMLAQGMTDANDTNLIKKFISRMKKCDRIRGLEREIHPPTKNLSLFHYRCVFEKQEKLRKQRLWGTDTATKNLAKCTQRSSKAFAHLAIRLAQYDTREAMKAAFTFDGTTHPTFRNSCKGSIGGKSGKSFGKVSRRASMGEVSTKSALPRIPRPSRRASLWESQSAATNINDTTTTTTTTTTTNTNSSSSRSSTMRTGGLDRRKLLAHTTSMRSVKSKYGSLGVL